MSIRVKLALAVGLPLLVVYVATVVVLLGEVRTRSHTRLERAVTERVVLIAAWVDERLARGVPPGEVLVALPLVASGERPLRTVVLAPDGDLLASSEGAVPAGGLNVRRMAQEAARDDLERMWTRVAAGESGVVRARGLLDDEARWVGFAPLRSRAGAVLATAPESVVLAFERDQLRLGIGILSAGLVAILAAVLLASAAITRPVRRLASAVARLGEGDLDAHVEGVETRDEIGALASAFNRMVRDLRSNVAAREREAAARDAIERELKIAREIQTALLPDYLPHGDAYALHARHMAARRVAGDFFDGFHDASGRIVFLIGDVSGKGAAAAIFMAHARLVVRQALEESPTLAEAIAVTNETLRAEEAGSMYLTLFVGRFDPGSGGITYVNAGHPRPLRLDAAGRTAPFGEVTGGVVGLIPGWTYDERHERLAAGERLVVFSDGVPDATRSDGTPLGEDGIAAILAGGPRDAAPEDVCQRLLQAVDDLQGGRLVDDVTVLVVARA